MVIPSFDRIQVIHKTTYVILYYETNESSELSKEHDIELRCL
jgi:hypothetical protein